MALEASQFDFLFEAANEGLELQHQIDTAATIGRPVMAETLGSFVKDESSRTPEELAAEAVEAFSLAANTERLRAQLSEKEQMVGEQLAGMHLSVRVLDGDDRKPIVSTYFSSGAVGSRQQEFDYSARNHRNGTFRAALLGQNALVLYPQWMSGKQMDMRNIVAPILREDGERNIAVEQRERTWRDRFGPHFPLESIMMGRRHMTTAERYKRRSNTDIQRLRELATQL
jgi:hypothetical protein